MQNPSGGKTALGLDTNVGAMICYLGNLICGIGGLIYSILVITQDKINPLARFHAFQSLFLTISCIVLSVALYVVMFVGIFIDAAIGLPVISGLMGLLLLGVCVGYLVFWILAMIKAYGGEKYKIPVIGNFAEKYSSQ